MVTAIAGAGRTREPGEIFYRRLLDATSLDDSGYVLSLALEGGVYKVQKCTNAQVPYAINYRSTRDPHDLNFPPTVFQTGANLGEMPIPLVDDGWMKLKVDGNNAAIIPGDPLYVKTTAGKVDKYAAPVVTDDTVTTLGTSIQTIVKEQSYIVGTSEDVVAAGGGGNPGADKVLTKLVLHANLRVATPTIA